MRETSLSVYRLIKEKGILSRRRLDVYECLVNHGRLTMQEVTAILCREGKVVTLQGTSGRFSELESMGLVIDSGERRKNVSGNQCVVWAVTNNLPSKLEKPKSNRQRLAEALETIDLLRRQIVSLTKGKQPELFT